MWHNHGRQAIFLFFVVGIVVMPPLKIIIVRHGERLDRVERNWGKSADRAHDPPITGRGDKMAVALGEYYLAKLVDAAFAAQGNHPKWGAPYGDDTVAFTVGQALGKCILMSSPLRRCVETSHGIAVGLHRAAVEYLAQHGIEVAPSDLPLPRVLIEDSLAEEDRWINHDLRGAKDPFPTPVLHDAAYHAAKTSPLVVPTLSSRPSRLRHTEFVAIKGRFAEVEPSKPTVKLSVEQRSLAATDALLAGAIDDVVDGTFTFCVSHGKTSVVWYNAIVGNLERVGGEVKPTKQYNDARTEYTAFVEFTQRPNGTGYGVTSSVFSTPHLNGNETRSAGNDAEDE